MSRNKCIFLFFVMILQWAALVPALEKRWDMHSETILRTFERQDEEGADNLFLPVYQYLAVDYGRPLDTGLSFHAHGWGRYDLSGSDFFDDTGDGELLYGYAGYRFSENGPAIKLGRQRIITGLMGVNIDGISLQTAVSKWLTISGYGGVPAFDDSYTDQDGQRIYGSRLGLNIGMMDAGVSYQSVQEATPEDDSKIGVDVYAVLPMEMVFSGYSAINTVSGSWAEHAYEVQIPVKNIMITPMYQQIRFQDLFDEGSLKANPFRFLGETDEVLTAAGGDVSLWKGPLEIGGQMKKYVYDRSSISNLYSAGFLNWTAGYKAEVGFECGIMTSDSPENRFVLGRSCVKMNGISFFSRKDTVTGDIMYVKYLEPIYNRENSYSAVVSYNRRFLKDSMVMVISGEYSRDPYFDSDIGATLIFVYDGGNLEVQP